MQWAAVTSQRRATTEPPQRRLANVPASVRAAMNGNAPSAATVPPTTAGCRPGSGSGAGWAPAGAVSEPTTAIATTTIHAARRRISPP